MGGEHRHLGSNLRIRCAIMAIKIDLQTSQFGLPFAGAYFRIVTAAVTRQRQGGNVKFDVMIDAVGYATSTPKEDTQPVDFRRYHAPLDEINEQFGTDFLSKCYNWVANQSDMDGAVPA